MRALQAHPLGGLCVAFSGGPDSTALLHALATLGAARTRGLRAMHIDHGLHADSGSWAAHCRDICAALNVPIEIHRVQVDRQSGTGLEAAAREARYLAFAAELRADEYLLLAHHQDDQAETVLLKLLRGSGPDALGGMRTQRPLGKGVLWRPLLDIPREVLHAYIADHALSCIHDPSNDDANFSRNRLRHEILPRLTAHWPQAVVSITHSAGLARAAAETLREHWLQAFEQLHDPTTGSLDARGWIALPAALRDPLLDYWLHAQQLRAPTTGQRQQIAQQCHAQGGQLPCIRWPGVELHVWKNRLWALTPPVSFDTAQTLLWHGEPLQLADHGELSLQPDIRLATPLQVRGRRGGERIKPAGDRYSRELRDLFQMGAIPPWQRAGCPLIYAGDELIAVADRWITDRGEALFQQAGARPHWRPAMRLSAQTVQRAD